MGTLTVKIKCDTGKGKINVRVGSPYNTKVLAEGIATQENPVDICLNDINKGWYYVRLDWGPDEFHNIGPGDGFTSINNAAMWQVMGKGALGLIPVYVE
jgi:hypothetical protein